MKLSRTLKALLVVGALSATGFTTMAQGVMTLPSDALVGELTGEEEMLVTGPVADSIQDTIVAVDLEAQTITLGDAEDVGSQVVVRVTEETVINQANEGYTIKDLQVGQEIIVLSNGMMTEGVVNAIEVMLVERELVTGPVADSIQDTIVAVDLEAQTITLGDAEDLGSQVVVRVTEESNVKHPRARRYYRINDLQVGQEVMVLSNGMMTEGVIDAIEVVFVEQPQPETTLPEAVLPEQPGSMLPELEEEGTKVAPITCPVAARIQDKVVAVDEEAQTITLGTADEEASHITVKITEETTIKHEKNRRYYRINDLVVGQELIMESNGMMVDGEVTAIEITLVDSEESK